VKQKRAADDGRSTCNYLTRRGRALKSELANVPMDLLCDVGLALDDAVELRARLRALIAKLQQLA